MRGFLLLVVGLLVGALVGIVADRMSPTKEMIDPIAERYLPSSSSQDATALDFGEGPFSSQQLAAFGLESCFPRADVETPEEQPWLVREGGALIPDDYMPEPFPDLADYPGLIKIEGIRSTLGSEREHCAAARIAEHWFLTAAHCIIDLDLETAKPTYDVIAITPAYDVRTEGIAVSSIRGAICHAAYGMNRQQYPNDVALFYVDDISAFEEVAIAQLETGTMTLLPRDLTETYIAGWGRNGQTRYLQGGPVKMTEVGEAILIGDKIGTRGPNVGDSGAPLYATTPEGPLIVGILSQVTQDRDQNGDRSIYIRAKAVHDWVERTMSICEQGGDYVCGPESLPGG